MSQCLPNMPCYGTSEAIVYKTYPRGCSTFANYPCLVSTGNVCYSGAALPNSEIISGDTMSVALQKIDELLNNFSNIVLTINGVSYDLSQDRTWVVGDVLTSGSYADPSWITSLDYSKITGAPSFITLTSLSSGIGISYNNLTGVITNSSPDQTVVLNNGTSISVSGSYPNFTITNTAPDQTVVLTNGTGISISGSYPNFTITNTGVGTTYTSSNGITLLANDFTLGGSLTGNTTITGGSFSFNVTTNNNLDLRSASTGQTILASGTGGLVLLGRYLQSGQTNFELGNNIINVVSPTFAFTGATTLSCSNLLTIDGGAGITLNASGGYIKITNLPTSSAGLPANAIWNNLGVINIV